MEISNAAKDLASRAKGSGSPLTQEENNGATFSVSNLGMFDIDEFVAIVVPPQSAILSVGKANDEVIEDKGVKVFIDPAAIIYLLGTEMDYKKEKFSSQFVFNNPNETERCGCGESFKT